MAIKNAYLKNHNRLLAIAQNENITQKRRTGKEGAEQKLLGVLDALVKRGRLTSPKFECFLVVGAYTSTKMFIWRIRMVWAGTSINLPAFRPH